MCSCGAKAKPTVAHGQDTRTYYCARYVFAAALQTRALLFLENAAAFELLFRAEQLSNDADAVACTGVVPQAFAGGLGRCKLRIWFKGGVLQFC